MGDEGLDPPQALGQGHDLDPVEQDRHVLRCQGGGDLARLVAQQRLTGFRAAGIDVQVYAGTSAPFNFNGLVRHYFMRRGPNVADLQVNLLHKDERDRSSHEIAKAIRPLALEVASRHGIRVKVAEIPPGPPVTKFDVWAPKLAQDSRISMEDRVPQARIFKTWVGPHWSSADADLLTIAGAILSTGKSSRLYQRLVYKDQTATGTETTRAVLQGYAAATGDGRLRGDMHFALQLDGGDQVPISVTAAETSGFTEFSRLVDLVNAKLEASALAGLVEAVRVGAAHRQRLMRPRRGSQVVLEGPVQ